MNDKPMTLAKFKTILGQVFKTPPQIPFLARIYNDGARTSVTLYGPDGEQIGDVGAKDFRDMMQVICDREDSASEKPNSFQYGKCHGCGFINDLKFVMNHAGRCQSCGSPSLFNAEE